MNSKKIMMLITALSLVIVLVVVMIVHSGKKDEPASIPIAKDSIAIGDWSTDIPGAADAEEANTEGETSAEKTMKEVSLTLAEDGDATGTFGKYDFEGSWEPVSKYEIRLINSRGESVYRAVIEPSDEETESPSMDLAAKDVTDSMTWKLYKK